MQKFKNLPVLKRITTSFYSLFIYYPSFIWKLKKTMRITNEYAEQQLHIQPIIQKITIDGFQNTSSLARWSQVDDREYGGDSLSQIQYNEQLKAMNLSGKISTDIKDKLQTQPFIGMAQRIYSTFKIEKFNSIRVQLIGDGNPVHCQLIIFSPVQDLKIAHAFILTSKSPQLITYQLPFRNFQMKGQQILHQSSLHNKQRQTVSLIMDQQCPYSSKFQIHRISFRLVSTIDIQRSITFKKIQLVKTMRGDFKNMYLYLKPYFYIVDDEKEKDQIFDVIDTGDFVFGKKKQ